MKPSPPAPVLTVAALALLALLAASCGKPGWPVFESRLDIPDAPGPAFTVSYPPWFERAATGPAYGTDGPWDGGGQEGAEDPGNPGDQAVMAVPAGRGLPFRTDIASRPDSVTGGTVYLYAVAEIFPEDEKARLAGAGAAPFWRETGERLAAASGGMFRGSGPLAQHGARGGDVMYTSEADPGGTRGGTAYLFIRRYLMQGDVIVSAICAVPDPLRDARRDNFSLMDFPAVRGVCAPFLDSLELAR
ncbi:MAG: hypothetical protein LBT40_17090 [Deltaproteobacteria bacterium]|nr:hypothetical protein [Deltaproteobacteria bacterium]